jgi:major vault protein
MADAVIRIKPYYYIHLLDNNSNVTRVEVGPATLTRQDHEKLVAGPEPMIMIPPRHYCIIANPVDRTHNKPIIDSFGQVKIRWGDEEIRFDQEPFPLFPGEKLYGKVSPLQVVAPNSALRLRAIRDFAVEEVTRKAGDEWLFSGPGTYVPRVEVQVVEIVKAIIVKQQQAIKLRARRELTSKDGLERKAGEEWLVRSCCAYLPSVDEEVVDTVQAYVLTPLKALHLRANRTFADIFTVDRKAGEEWLVTSDMAETHIPDVHEIVVGEVPITTLTNRQWTVVVDPIGKDGRPQLGKRELRKGELSFFLRPGERLEEGVKNVYVLGEQEALLLRSKEEYLDLGSKMKHMPGDRWMVYGPCDYIPPVEVEVVERRRSIPLDTNEGVYVRDIKSGKVRVEMGQSYMLKPNEELWPKELPTVVEELLKKDVRMAEVGVSATAARDKTRVVAYRAPHNSAVQVYDYKEKRARVVFGPELVILGPDEHFTVVSLSGGKPKAPHLIKTLALLLGPDFMTDIVIVETSDHARLSLKLSYNWQFEIKEKDGAKLFQVPDFVGDACKAIAARVRGAVAAVSFELFHKTSAKLIREAVFGGVENNKFVFKSNNLVISNVDIQSVEPVDQKTRDSLQKSVQLAIEITTKSQEANARHEAERLEQEAKGRLDRQKLHDEAEAEKARKELLRLQAQSSTVETTGQATAEARARADSAQIEGESAVKQADLKAQASRIKAEADLRITSAKQDQELVHQQSINDMDVVRARELAAIEAQKFKDTVKAIGPETIKAIAQAGPEMQLKLLSGLGLKSIMITDGNSPINLFSTAAGLVAPPQAPQ